MRLAVGFVPTFVVTFCFGFAQAQDLGREWRSLEVSETSLIFTAPGLESAGKRFMLSNAPNYSHTTEVGIWASPSVLFPKAQIVLQKLSPGYSFTYGMEIDKFINNLKFVRDKNPTVGERTSASNSIGEIVYRKFSFGEFECIAFGQNFGDPAYDPQVLDYLDLLFGFYCGDSGEKLSSISIAQVVKSIGVKGAGSP